VHNFLYCKCPCHICACYVTHDKLIHDEMGRRFTLYFKKKEAEKLLAEKNRQLLLAKQNRINSDICMCEHIYSRHSSESNECYVTLCKCSQFVLKEDGRRKRVKQNAIDSNDHR
jgi:hypothetical protein